MTERPATARTWPIPLIAAPAAVAIWTGWVGLGGMTGFGRVAPLPGITSWSLDTRITLPIGVEAYAAFALSVWLRGSPPPGARRFAKWSAVGSLALGMAGQVAYHLMAARHVTAAPWWITTLVSCLPVAVLGMGAALAHLLCQEPAPEAVAEAVAEVVAESAETRAATAHAADLREAASGPPMIAPGAELGSRSETGSGAGGLSIAGPAVASRNATPAWRGQPEPPPEPAAPRADREWTTVPVPTVPARERRPGKTPEAITAELYAYLERHGRKPSLRYVKGTYGGNTDTARARLHHAFPDLAEGSA